MASQVCETVAFINNEEMEVLEIKGDLLMSLMEESPSDESDDERLHSLIRSFEAEISGSKMGDHEGSQLKSNFEEDIESWNIEQVEEFGVEWVDMDLMPSSQFHDGSWGVDPRGDEQDVMVDHLMVCDGFDMEDHAYNSFWLDNYEMQLVH